MAELHALGRSGGAGRVDQGQQVVGADGRDRVGDVEVGVDRLERGERMVAAVAVDHDQSLDLGQLRARLLEGREERRLDHRHLRSRVRAHVLDLLGRRGLVDRERDRAERDCAHVDRDELGTVVEHQGDRVALADAEAREPAGDPPDLVAELVPADPHGVVTLARDDRRIVAQPLDGLVEGDGQVLRIQLATGSAAHMALGRRGLHRSPPLTRGPGTGNLLPERRFGPIRRVSGRRSPRPISGRCRSTGRSRTAPGRGRTRSRRRAP